MRRFAYTKNERALSQCREGAFRLPISIESNVKDKARIAMRRMQIVKASVALFKEKGYHRTTTREIAKASGLSNGTLYEYVTSKEDVLFLVCQHIHNEVLLQLQDSMAERSVSGRSRLRHAIESFLRVVDAMQDDILIIYQESKSLPRPFLKEVLDQERMITDVFAKLLEQGIEDGSLRFESATVQMMAHNIVVTGQMWAFRRWAFGHISFEAFVKQQVDMWLQACGAV